MSISLHQRSEVSYSFVFLVCSSRGLPKYNEAEVLTICFYFIWSFFKKIFLKTKTSLTASFSAWFLQKNISDVMFINWSNLIAWSSLLFEISGNVFIIIVCYPVCDVMNFEISLEKCGSEKDSAFGHVEVHRFSLAVCICFCVSVYMFIYVTLINN